jgi:hypothetical protein
MISETAVEVPKRRTSLIALVSPPRRSYEEAGPGNDSDDGFGGPLPLAVDLFAGGGGGRPETVARTTVGGGPRLKP